VLPEIVVTATRAERSAWEVGRGIGVISKSKLGSPLANSAAEVISQYKAVFEFSTNLDTIRLRATTWSLFTHADVSGTVLTRLLDRWSRWG